MVVIVIISDPDPFNGFYKNERNLSITFQSHLEFWKIKDDSSYQSKEFDHLVFLAPGP